MHKLILLVMSGAGEWLVIILIPLLILFFVFKAGQWYGMSRRNKGDHGS